MGLPVSSAGWICRVGLPVGFSGLVCQVGLPDEYVCWMGRLRLLDGRVGLPGGHVG